MILEIKFNYLDTEDKVVVPYNIHPLYDEVRNTFSSYLGVATRTIRKYTEYKEYGEFEMIELTLKYKVPEDKTFHTECLIKLLENLDMDLQFNLED